MGLRGPPPTPTAINRIRGFPGKRKPNPKEPAPPLRIPECPDHLDEVSKQEWNRICPILLGMRVLTDADYIALGTLCQAYGTMIEAQRQLNKSGILYKTQTGFIKQSPLLAIIKNQQHIMCTLLKEFGLTPSSRTRVQTAQPKDEAERNPFAELG